MQVGRDKWTLTPAPRPDARLRLICFHHAGGGAYGFAPWARRLRADVELVAVQLPGRENRAGEPAMTSVEAVLDAVEAALGETLDRPYALFGHSLGAVLAYLFACRAQGLGAGGAPTRLFRSAAIPPPLRDDENATPAAISDAALIRKLTRLGGTPAAVLEDPRLLKSFLPALRADFDLLSRCVYDGGPPLPMPATLFRGRDDRSVSAAEFEGWRERFAALPDEHLFSGGHFFIHDAQARVLEIINERLPGPA
jgi:medium-chain acyl-[acyl-carrier-protein] hydrolase